MDINGDPSENDGPALKESTLREIAILRRVAGHPYISNNKALNSSFYYVTYS